MEKLTPLEEESLVTAMASAVMETVKSFDIHEPAYALILTYSVDVFGDLLPWAAVGLARERADFIKNAPLDAADLMWDQNVLTHCDPLESLLYDEDFMKRFERFQKETQASKRPADKITALMLRVCFLLQKAEWSGLFPLTEDFTVAALTVEGAGLLENLSMLLSDEAFSALLHKGYLPLLEDTKE